MIKKPDDKFVKKWYPLYTRSRFEKKAYDNLIRAGYEAYLPLKKSIRQWSDRKKMVDMPLMNSYIFVKLDKTQLYNVLQIHGIVRFIYFNNQPATVREKDLELIKSLLTRNTEIEIIDGTLQAGKEILIKSGIMKGYKGRVHSINNQKKLIIEIEGINKTMLVTLESMDDIDLS